MRFTCSLSLSLILYIFSLLSNSVNCVTIDVKTTSGLVRGQTIQVLNQTLYEFLGIPYAEPPVGDLRFAKPLPLKKHIESVIDGTVKKNSCMQTNTGWILNPTYSEDCLVLNIWSQPIRNNTLLKPVMFYIHGGGFTAGSIYQLPAFNGSILTTYDVVYVSTNYRLGPFGFLYGGEESAPGNVGLYDQVLALKWTRENIHLFGGDPQMITIFGESAGSWAVSLLILSPLSQNLYKRAILESGAHLRYKNRPIVTKSEALSYAKQMSESFGCSDNKWLQCLRNIDANHIINYTEYMNTILSIPIEETEFLPLSTQKAFNTLNFSRDIDIIAGITRDEGLSLAQISATYFKTEKDFIELLQSYNRSDLDALNITKFYLTNVNTSDSFALWKAFGAFYGDLNMLCPTYLFAKLFAEFAPNKNVYFYEWTYVGEILRQYWCDTSMGICHTADLEFVFGLPLHTNSKSMVDINFSKEVMTIWTNFAKHGNPGSNINWPRLIDSGVKNAIPRVKEMNANNKNHIFENLFEKTCDGFWKTFFL